MTLKKLADKNNGDSRINDTYSTKDSLKPANVAPEGFVDVVSSLDDKLGVYCKFRELPSDIAGTRGGRVPDRDWFAIIETQNGGEIRIEISQSYQQPGVVFAGAEINLKYGLSANFSDIDIVRKAITDSGLEKIEA